MSDHLHLYLLAHVHQITSNVNPAGGNLIVTPPMNATVMEGERAEFECLPKSAEWIVQWYKDGAPLEALPELAARSEHAHNGSLVLRQAASSDPGEYSCRVRADTGDTQSASAFLDVQCEYPHASRVPLVSPCPLPS